MQSRKQTLANLCLFSVTALWLLSYEWRFELYDGYEFRPWRLLLLIFTVPGMISGLWLYFMPESPKFLLTQDRNEEALEVVRWMYRTNKGKANHDDFPVVKLQSEHGAESVKNLTGR